MAVPLDREWASFTDREPSLLKPDHKPRDPATVTFPFSDHPLTKPLLESHLARKSNLLKRRSTAYYVLTPTGFLLEYKDADHILYPDPTVALKLSDCVLGNAPSRSGKAGFTLRGKDSGKSLGRTHEWVFVTDSMEQATLWWGKVEKFVGMAGGADVEVGSDEESPVSPSSVTSKEAVPAGQTAGPTTAGPSATAAPTSAPTGGAGHVHAAGATTTTAPVQTTTAAPGKSVAQAAATQAAATQAA